MKKLVIFTLLLTITTCSWGQKKKFTQHVAVEEYTGTACGYCTRGWQGMENLREWYGDQFVGIALHWYNSSDPMYFSRDNYAPITFKGAPGCRMNRGDLCDPHDGVRASFEKALRRTPAAGVVVRGEWNADKSQIKATATMETNKTKDYDIEFVIVADDLHDQTWAQKNYYCTYDPSEKEADLAKFCAGGEYGQEILYDLHFNDVCLGSSYVNKENTSTKVGRVSAGSSATSTCTLSMPTSEKLLPVIQYDKVYIVALVIDTSTGTIENSIKSPISNTTAINDNRTPTPSVVSRHSVDGRQLSSPQRGINIIRNSDGSVRKAVF